MYDDEGQEPGRRGFWADRYPIGDLAVYNRALELSAENRLQALWSWKSLNRAYEFGDVLSFLVQAETLCESVDGAVADEPVQAVTQAFLQLRERLREGPLSPDSNAVVTPQFLLHGADSKGTYSGRFPLLDVWVARAHRIHTADNENRTLQWGLTCGRSEYERLVGYLFNHCETAAEVARFERALFVQGQAVGWYASLVSDFESHTGDNRRSGTGIPCRYRRTYW